MRLNKKSTLWLSAAFVMLLLRDVGVDASFFICPAPCEAMFLPIDMDSLDDCLCPSGTHFAGTSTLLHDNKNDQGGGVIFHCPPHSSARMLHPMSFADCQCDEHYNRDENSRRCIEGGFLCYGKYRLKAGLQQAQSLSDCMCVEPYVKDDSNGVCMLEVCPRAGNYIQKATAVTVKTLADCTCTEPLMKNDQSGECVTRNSFQCPAFSSAIPGRHPKSFADCECVWGYVRKQRSGVGVCEREGTVYQCPPNSMRKKSLSMPPQSFADCDCLEDQPLHRNEMMQSCERYNSDGLPSSPRPITCPPYSRALAPIVHDIEQCKCIDGYGFKYPEMICVRLSGYKCPPHSHKITRSHVEESFKDCACAKGYFRDEDAGSCRELRLTTGNGCPKNAFLMRWPLQISSNCRCVHDFASNQPHGKDLVCNEPKDSVSQCPPNSFLNNWPLAKSEDCSCKFGFEKEPLKDGTGMGCTKSVDPDYMLQHAACAHPKLRSEFTGGCRFLVEEVKPWNTGVKQTGKVVFKGIEYTFVLVESNIMVIQGDVAIGELADVKDLTTDGPVDYTEYVLHGYYNDERDHRWKDATMCYEYSESALRYRSSIESAMQKISDLTGFHFKKCGGGSSGSCSQYQECHDFISFMETHNSCFSYIGRIGGKQTLGVSSDCGEGNFMHVLLHAMGLHHTIDRPDRDDHIRIAWECVPEDKRSYFIIEDTVENKDKKFVTDVPYDFYSIMHHPSDAFVPASATRHHPMHRDSHHHSIPDWCRSVFPMISGVYDREEVLSSMGQRIKLAVTDVHYVWTIYPFLKDEQRLQNAIEHGRVDVHLSRLHTPRDVTAEKADTFLESFRRSNNGFTSRLVHVFGAFAVLSAFAATAFFVSVELKKRAMRSKQDYYAETLLEKNLYD